MYTAEVGKNPIKTCILHVLIMTIFMLQLLGVVWPVTIPERNHGAGGQPSRSLLRHRKIGSTKL